MNRKGNIHNSQTQENLLNPCHHKIKAAASTYNFSQSGNLKKD
jgi:hypothetical protein